MPDLAASLIALSPARRASALAVIEYMLGAARLEGNADKVLSRMSDLILAGGVPLDRSASIVALLNAETLASARYWERGKGTRHATFPFGSSSQSGYNRSPAAVAIASREWLSFRIPETPDEAYGIVTELRREGFVHYVTAPVFMANGMTGTFSFATRNAEGFSDDDIHFLRAVFPSLAACQEILATHRIMGEIMRTYVGEEPRRRILSGDVRRGEVMHIQAAILFADMRNFTGLTSVMSAEQATGLLNRYYDCLVPCIESAGGEVLKFIGDGILAIFRGGGDEGVACRAAIDAARGGLNRVAAETGSPRFDVGISLHFGSVAYGNVGSGMRLDYTVIGCDVNIAARIAALCGSLGDRLLVSSAFRDRTIGPVWQARGPHILKGLAVAEHVFAPDG